MDENPRKHSVSQKGVFRFRTHEEFEEWKIDDLLSRLPASSRSREDIKQSFRERDKADYAFLHAKIVAQNDHQSNPSADAFSEM